MAIFIELVTDSFDTVFAEKAYNKSSRAGKAMARRPTRGIEIKDDTYAYLKVILPNGKELPLLDSSSPTGENKWGYTNFILQQVSESRMEKHQVVETFGDSYVFFFGESPRFLDCTAVLLNTNDFNWSAEWAYNYENYLRGTKLVELGARCYMFWDDTVVEGYILNTAAVIAADQPYTVNMQFKFFVTKCKNISLVNVESYPVRRSVAIPAGLELSDANAFGALQNIYDNAASVDQVRAKASRELPMLVRNSNGGSGVTNSMINKLNQLPTSMVVDPAVWSKLTGYIGIADLASGSIEGSIRPMTGKVRGLIAENVDEYIGGDPSFDYYNQYPGGRASKHSDTQEFSGINSQSQPESLEAECINTLESIGASADNQKTLTELGLSPTVKPSGIPTWIGSGTNPTGYADGGVTFSPTKNDNSGDNYADGSQSDPLTAVYGDTPSKESAALDRQVTEGAGDASYGYKSPYGGVGFGKAGYGDFGGAGFGSCSSNGDPGFVDPAILSTKGINADKSAYTSWAAPLVDKTALTAGTTLSGRTTKGANLAVGGRSSAFATVALPGEFSGWVIEEMRSSSSVDLGSMWSVRLERTRTDSFIVGPAGYR